jgi:ferredoxin
VAEALAFIAVIWSQTSSPVIGLAVARDLVNEQISIAPEWFLPNLARQFSNKNMADAANKYPENVEGKFYVDDQCIDCDLCRETAPANFKRNDDGGHSFVYKQPESPEEEALCKEAMEGCPVEAIGSDG